MFTFYNRKSEINDIRKMINPFKREWNNIESTNCYAYALGIDADPNNFSFIFNFNPGAFIEESLGYPFTIEKLLTNLEGDFKVLGLEYIEVNPNFIVKKGEWKIATMVTSDCSLQYIDFHFLKQIENGIWTHKLGFRDGPIDFDGKHEKIENPIDCIIESGGLFTSNRYEYIKTYCLKKK